MIDPKSQKYMIWRHLNWPSTLKTIIQHNHRPIVAISLITLAILILPDILIMMLVMNILILSSLLHSQIAHGRIAIPILLIIDAISIRIRPVAPTAVLHF